MFCSSIRAITFTSTHPVPVQLSEHLRVLNELKLQQKRSASPVTIESVSAVLLDLYAVLNKKYRYRFISNPRKSDRVIFAALGRLLRLKNIKDKTGLPAGTSPADAAVIDRVLDNLARFQAFGTQDYARSRRELIDFICGTYRQDTQLEKSLSYHKPRFLRQANGTYNWDDPTFKAELNDFFRVNGFGAVATPASTHEESMCFFQDLLINEKLRPNHHVLYHSATHTLVGFHMFQNSLATLIQPEGFSFFSRFYTTKTIGGVLRAIQNVNDVTALIRTGRQDTEPEITPHITSSSYSLFGNGGQNSAISFYKGNQQVSSLVAAFDQAVRSFVDDGPGALPEVREFLADVRAGRYSRILEKKFRDVPIAGHPQTQAGYKPFPTLMQFFVRKDQIDNLVYFGSTAGAQGHLMKKMDNNLVK